MPRFRMLAQYAHASLGLMLLTFLATKVWSYGADFRLSFLDTGPVVKDTCSLLKSNGFAEITIKDFKHLVEYHNRDGNRVDLGKFPRPNEGYYQFDGIGDFTNRLSGFFSETPGNNTLEQTTLFAQAIVFHPGFRFRTCNLLCRTVETAHPRHQCCPNEAI